MTNREPVPFGASPRLRATFRLNWTDEADYIVFSNGATANGAGIIGISFACLIVGVLVLTQPSLAGPDTRFLAVGLLVVSVLLFGFGVVECRRRTTVRFDPHSEKVILYTISRFSSSQYELELDRVDFFRGKMRFHYKTRGPTWTFEREGVYISVDFNVVMILCSSKKPQEIDTYIQSLPSFISQRIKLAQTTYETQKY